MWGVTPGAGTGARTTDCNGWDYWAIPHSHPAATRDHSGSGGPQIVASGMGTTDAAASYAAIGRRLFANTVYHCGPGGWHTRSAPPMVRSFPKVRGRSCRSRFGEAIDLEPTADLTVGVGFDVDGNAATGDAFEPERVGRCRGRVSDHREHGWHLDPEPFRWGRRPRRGRSSPTTRSRW